MATSAVRSGAGGGSVRKVQVGPVVVPDELTVSTRQVYCVMLARLGRFHALLEVEPMKGGGLVVPK